MHFAPELPMRRCSRCMLAALALLAAGCASVAEVAPGMLLETAARGQPLSDVACVAVIGGVRWEVRTPARVDVGNARGELRVVCNHPGFRSAELIFRPVQASAAGFWAGYGSAAYGSNLGGRFPLVGAAGRYPKRLVIDMNPE